MSPTAIIAEDEPILARGLKTLLSRLWPELTVRGIAHNGPGALALMTDVRPDVAFLDIQMPGYTGLDVAAKADSSVRIVFVTAFDQFAVEAFEREAVDYILKPVTEERLAMTVARLKKRLARPAADGDDRIQRIVKALAQQAPPERLRLIRVKTGDELRLVPVSEVLFFKAEDKYTVVRTREREFLIRTPIKDLEQDLDPDQFWRVHRSAIVNIDRIEAIRRSFTNQMMIAFPDMDETIPVSRSHAHLFAHM